MAPLAAPSAAPSGGRARRQVRSQGRVGAKGSAASPTRVSPARPPQPVLRCAIVIVQCEWESHLHGPPLSLPVGQLPPAQPLRRQRVRVQCAAVGRGRPHRGAQTQHLAGEGRGGRGGRRRRRRRVGGCREAGGGRVPALQCTRQHLRPGRFPLARSAAIVLTSALVVKKASAIRSAASTPSECCTRNVLGLAKL